MKFLVLSVFAVTVLAVSAQVCQQAEVVFLIDQSENAKRASSWDQINDPFRILKNIMLDFFRNPAVANSPNFRIGAYGFSSSSDPVTIIMEGSSPQVAQTKVESIGQGKHAGSWTYRGLESIKTSPRFSNSLLIILSSQGSGSAERRSQTKIEYDRVTRLGWKTYVIALQGVNQLDREELRMVNGGQEPVILRDVSSSTDPKSYRLLDGELKRIINDILCKPVPTAASGLCSQCLFEGGYGFDFDPEFCDTFYQCLPDGKPIKRQCSSGTFWDGVQCNYINSVPCTVAKCDWSVPDNTRYPSGCCCNKYYQCNGGILADMKCPVGEVYDHGIRACQVARADPKDVCAASGRFYCDVDLRGPLATKNCSGYAPDPMGNPCFFQYMGISLPVSAGTIWDQSECSLKASDTKFCSGTDSTNRDYTKDGLAAVCNAVFMSNFNAGSRTVYSERYKEDMKIYSILQEAVLTNDALTFTSTMKDPFLYYYYFNNREIRSNTAFRLRFRLDNPQFNQVYDLLSNKYCALCDESIGFTVTASSTTRSVVTATFKTGVPSSVSTSAVIDTMSANDLLEMTVVYGDTNVYGKVRNLVNGRTVDFNIMSKPSDASIALNKCGIQLGRGTHNHFVGMIDEFAMYEYCQDISSVLR